MVELNKKGFLCFLIVLSFASIHSLISSQAVTNELSEGIALAIEAERVSFIKALLEENTDFIVKEVLSKKALLCDTPARELKGEVNKALLNYFHEIEKCCAEVSIKFSASNGVLNAEFMNNNSSALMKKVGKQCIAQYTFHGGALKKEFVSAQLKGKAFSQEFRLPPNYSAKSTVSLK